MTHKPGRRGYARRANPNQTTPMTTQQTTITESEAIAALRRRYPAMRRTRSTAIIHSGGQQTIFGCVCGAQHSTSTEWRGREAKHVVDWRDEHADCAAEILAAGKRPEFG